MCSGSSARAQEASAADPTLAAADHPVELTVYAGRWDFNSTLRFEDDVVLGIRAGAGFFPWLTVEIELDQIITQSRRDQSWARAVGFGMHGRVEPWSRKRVSVGGLAGVSFMATEDDGSPDALSEGFDVGLHLRFNATGRVILRPEFLGRYQSVRFVPVDASGNLLPDDAHTEYLWSSGIRMGVSVAF
jgi:hypothetical protein